MIKGEPTVDHESLITELITNQQGLTNISSQLMERLAKLETSVTILQTSIQNITIQLYHHEHQLNYHERRLNERHSP